MQIDQITRPDPETKYDGDIAVAKEASRLHLWRDLENQHRNFTTFLSKLTELWCAIPDSPISGIAPTLTVDPACPIPHYIPTCDPTEPAHVVMDKYSVITMLHEFGHHVGMEEAECKLYSEWVFAHAFPVSFSRLERDARGYLCKPGTGVTMADLAPDVLETSPDIPAVTDQPVPSRRIPRTRQAATETM